MKRKWSRVYRDTIGGAGQRESVEALESRVVLAGVGAPFMPAAGAGDAFGAVSVGVNVNISRTTGHEAGGTIAIDPTNPARVFAATETEGGSGSPSLLGAYSIDGGATWTTRLLASGLDDLPRGEHNPQAAFDPFGNLYVTYLETVSQRAVHVAVSTDGGQTLAPLHSVVGPALDQPSIAVGGDSTAGASSVWVSYRNGSGSISATGARATGLGAVGVFGAPQSVPGGVGNFGDVGVGPQGQLVVTWQTNTAGEGVAAIRVSTDVDGLGPGNFSAPRTVAATNVGGFDFLPAQPNRAIAAEANLVYDLSPGGRRGWLYLAYTDESPDESNDFDVYVRSSSDHGHTWSAPVRVNDDGTGRSQFLPEIAVDQTTGRLAVGWYDARDDTGVIGAGSLDGVPNNDVAYWGALSTDGGATFQNFRVAAGASNAVAAGQPSDFGDNTGLAFHGGIIRPVWADNAPALPDNGGRPRFDLATAAVVAGPQAGPRVVASDPVGQQFAPTDHVDFQFDRRMGPGSFILGDVRTFTGPSGSLLSQLTGFQWLNDNRTLRVSFQPLTAAGQYSITLGPDILSAGAAAMDQDADGIPAESTEDRYTHTFTLTPPRVVANGPASPQVGTLGNFEFEFNQPMDPSSFAVADDVVAFTSPTGEDLRVSITGSVWLNDNRRLRVEFDSRGGEGVYTMSIGPGIASAGGGWAMDQDGDLVPGEAASDRYTGTVTVDRSIGPDGSGYQALTHALQAIDLVPGASGVSTLIDDADDETASIPLGSNRFNFYGRTYTGSNALYVSSNGLITFGGAHGDFRNGDLTSAPSRPTIAPLWDDWRTDVGADSRVLYRFDNLTGDSSPERLVIEWNVVPNASGAQLNPATFQAILQLNTSAIPGEIILNYPDLDVTAATANDGASATVGIKGEGTQGSSRLLVSLNSATSPYVATGKAIRIATTTQPSQPPTLNNIVVTPGFVQTGAPVILTAGAVVDVDGGIAAVNFYRESNGRSGLQTGSGGDALVGTDTSSAGGYALTVLTTGLAADTYTYYAQAVDNRGLTSDAATTTHVVDNSDPTVEIVNVSPDPRSETVRSITIRFSEPVTGFDIADLSLKRNSGPNILTSQSLTSADGGVTWTLSSGTTLAPVAGNYVLTLTASGSGITDLAGNLLTSGDSDSWRQNALVVSRLTFYNQSNFDGYTPDATANDDIAIAADKTALLPGNKATFANITSYDKGINGVIIDMWGLVATPTAADLQFRVGRTGDPSRWPAAPAPTSILRRPGRGEDDSDRIMITWAKGAIRNQWLRVTVLANANTGLSSSDVFYFGNLAGEAGNVFPTSTEARVTAFDVADVRRNYSPVNNVLVTNRWDFNRDGRVNALDLVIARASYQRDSLNLLDAP